MFKKEEIQFSTEHNEDSMTVYGVKHLDSVIVTRVEVDGHTVLLEGLYSSTGRENAEVIDAEATVRLIQSLKDGSWKFFTLETGEVICDTANLIPTMKDVMVKELTRLVKWESDGTQSPEALGAKVLTNKWRASDRFVQEMFA